MLPSAPRLVLLALATLVAGVGCGNGDEPLGYECMTPLVLSFDRSLVEYVAEPGTSYFELGQHDPALTTAWPKARTPWLARDVDGDGEITSGRELFGSETALRGRREAVNGFQALAVLDTNANGRVDVADVAWDSVLVWRDENADRLSVEGELETLSAAGILWIDLPLPGSLSGGQTELRAPSTWEPLCDVDGNCEVERSFFGYVDEAGVEQTGAVVDIHLKSVPMGGADPSDQQWPEQPTCP